MTAEVRAARVAVTATFFLNGLLFGGWAARIPAVQDRLGLSEGSLGLALALIAIGAVIAMPLSGWLSARGGSRRTTRLALVCFAVAVPLAALAPSYALLLVGALLLGMSGGGLDVAMNAHGVAVERRHPRPILSSFHAAFSLGGLVGAALGAGAAALGVDVRVQLVVMGAVAAATGVLVTRSLLPARADHAEDEGPLLTRPPRALLGLGLVAFCGLLAEGAAADWSAVYVEDSLAASAGVAGLAFAAFSLTMFIGRLVGDPLAERWGPVALVRRGALVAVAGLGGALLVGHAVAALVGFACLGAGLAAIVPVVFRGAGATPGLAPGVSLAAVSTMGYLGFMAGPPVIGAVAELTSLPAALGLVVALVAVVAALAGRTRPAAFPVAAEPAPAPAAASAA